MPSPLIDETGKTFGRLTVLTRGENRKPHTGAVWVCVCQCGKRVEAHGIHLRSGNIRSCGCLHREPAGKKNKCARI